MVRQKAWMVWTEQATAKHPDSKTVNYQEDGIFPWMTQASGNWFNWVANQPYSYMTRLKTAKEPKMAFVNIVIDSLKSARSSTKVDKSQIPENPLAPKHVSAHCRLLGIRLPKGHMAEITASEELQKRTGARVISHEEAVKIDWENERKNRMTQDVNEMDETYGIDLITESGQTVQVKAYEVSRAEMADMETDWLIEVIDGNVSLTKL